MNFVVLGSGTSVPHHARSSAGFWLETASGSILLDLSASAIHRMAAERLDWANLDAIWISHFHLDHVGGVAPFLFGMKYAPETQNRKKALKIFGPRGLRKVIENFDRAGEYNLLKQPFPIEITEIDEFEKFEILPKIEAAALKTPHTDESCALHLRDDSGKTLVYSADTGFDKTLAEFAKNVDLFVLECSFVKEKPVETHLELAEAVYLIRQAAPKLTILTHLYPEWDEVDFEKKLAEFSFSGEILQAEDGMRLTVNG